MNRILLVFATYLLVATSLSAQNLPQRNVSERTSGELTVAYSFNNVEWQQFQKENISYLKPYIEGFGSTQQYGKPSLPVYFDIVVVPSEAVSVSVESNKTESSSGLAWPSQPLLSDSDTSHQPFTIDDDFYNNYNGNFPSGAVSIDRFVKFNGQTLALVKIAPVQYDPSLQQFVFHRNLSYTIHYNQSFTHPISESQKKQLSGICLNKESLGTIPAKAVSNKLPNYLILTHPLFVNAADSLAMWKTQLGYHVRIVSCMVWTPENMLDTIQNYYSRTGADLRYVALLGDHENVPGFNVYSSSASFVSDLQYSCMDGMGDYFPDLARGRISVSNSAQALMVVQKMINYERNPVSDPLFYEKVMTCAYFQDDDNDNYADRRFSQTAEDVYQYLNTILGYTANRVYVTGSGVTPLHWNNGTYSNGEDVPSYLQKPTFPWDGDYYDVNTAINAGRFLVMHRDHGYEDGWGDPAYSSTNVNTLVNGNKLPVVLSINCLTGKFLAPSCFSEVFLRKNNGGAVAVFGHADVSYSGYNDGLSLGIIDAIFANPGLLANFTGFDDIPGVVTSHPSYPELGDAAVQGLLRMTQTWGDGWVLEEYTYNLLQYFGDPALRIFTSEPQQIIASYQPTLHCDDTLFQVFSSNTDTILATIVQNGHLLGQGYIWNGSGSIVIEAPAPGNAILTLSKHNTVPQIETISVLGTCFHLQVNTSPEYPCTSQPVGFVASADGTPASWLWDFGSSATPQTAAGHGPHQVVYNSLGNHPYSLVVSSGTISETYNGSIEVFEGCAHNMVTNDTTIINSCSGFILDDGGNSPYSSSQTSLAIIRSPGATQFVLHASQFDVEGGSSCSEDKMRVYRGEGTGGTLMGTYCNTNPFPASLTITGDAFTILFVANDHLQADGFVVDWDCTSPGLTPQADFEANIVDECSGMVAFHDISMYQPTTWHWNFGDGAVANVPDPIHHYISTGTYTVELIVSNLHGADTATFINFIAISPQNPPTATGAQRCSSGVLNLSASSAGDVLWFDDSLAQLPIFEGNSFTTTLLTNSRQYFVASSVAESSVYGGKVDNTGTGGYFTNTNVHYLMFDVLEPAILKSVKVYAGSTGNRTITILDNSGDVYWSGTYNLTTGANVLTTDVLMLPGNNYRLAGPGSPNLYRNGDPADSPLPYPYDINGLIRITGSSAGYPNTMRYYYYFYNWEVKSLCESARVPVDAIILHQNPLQNVATPIVVCQGDTVDLQAEGSGTFSWIPAGSTNSSLSVTNAGQYSVVMTLDSCILNSSVVDVSFLPSAAGMQFSTVINLNDVSFIPSIVGLDYLWDFGDGNFSTLETPVHTYLSSPYGHIVTLTTFSACGSAVAIDTLDIEMSISGKWRNSNLKLYPNPANQQLTVEASEGFLLERISLFGADGRLIAVVECSGNKQSEIILSSFEAGVYFIKAEMDEGLIEYGRILKY
jgi:PKD repeat protein